MSNSLLIGLGAVAGRPDIRQAGPHLTIDRDRATDTHLGAGVAGESRVGLNAREDEHDLALGLNPALGAYSEPFAGWCDPGHARSDRAPNPVGAELLDDERAELGIHGGERAGRLLDQRHIQTPLGERVGHLDPDVARADDHR